MRKRVIFSILLLFMLVNLQVSQNYANATETMRKHSSVMLVINNIANTKYDDKLTKMMDESLHKKIDGIYNEMDSADYLTKFAGHSNENATAQDMLDLIKDSGTDYFVYAELQPFVKKSNFNLVYYDKAMTASFVLRIIDIKNCKELYNNKYSIESKDSTDYWFIGSGSVAKKALDSVLFRAGEAISVHLPL